MPIAPPPAALRQALRISRAVRRIHARLDLTQESTNAALDPLNLPRSAWERQIAVEDGEPTTLEAFCADNAECIDAEDLARLASASPGDVVNIDCGGGTTAVRVLGVAS